MKMKTLECIERFPHFDRRKPRHKVEFSKSIKNELKHYIKRVS